MNLPLVRRACRSLARLRSEVRPKGLFRRDNTFMYVNRGLGVTLARRPFQLPGPKSPSFTCIRQVARRAVYNRARVGIEVTILGSGSASGCALVARN